MIGDERCRSAETAVLDFERLQSSRLWSPIILPANFVVLISFEFQRLSSIDLSRVIIAVQSDDLALLLGQ